MRTIIIVGGGAAGLLAAISASKEGKKVLLFEKNEKLGKKLFITGKGRCNVTNACPPDEFLSHVVTNPRFLYSAFSKFTNEDMMDFLESEGLSLKTERGQRVFPQSDRAGDIIDVLRAACRKNKVEIHYNTKVRGLLFNEEKTVCEGVVLEDGTCVRADGVILACGGCSYPQTGSTGDGYALAESAGHTVREPQPSLVPFAMRETWCKELMGLSLRNVSIRIKAKKKTVYEGFGEFLFTHFGVSGPLVLTASTCLGKYQKELAAGELSLYLDLKPALDPEQLDRRFLREFDVYRNKNLSNVLDQLLPRKLVPIFLSEVGLPADKKVRDVSKKERRRMVETMKNLPMHLTGVRGFSEAIVTRGGVHVKEVNPATMESKKMPQLFLAGELLDVDAVTGGYNLQIAWTTGYVAGKNA